MPLADEIPDVADVIGELAKRLDALERHDPYVWIGMPIPWLGTTPASLSGEVELKPNWLIANGATVSRTKWSLLFVEYGTKYGVGDGSTTFGLPNLMGRMMVARNTSGTFNVAAGTTGGNETKTLSESEMPQHDHTISGTITVGGSDGTHTHGISDPQHDHYNSWGTQYFVPSGSTYQARTQTGSYGNNVSTESTGITGTNSTGSGHGHSASHSLTAANAGSGTAFSILNPYFVAECWLIFAGLKSETET